MAEQTSLWLFEGILLSLTEHNDISAAPSTYCVVKQKKPSMSPTYPIKRSTAQTMANPIVYFRAFFTCCNKRKEGGGGNPVNHSHEGRKKQHSLWVRERGRPLFFVFFPPAQDHNEWELYWVNVDQVWPGRDNVSLLVLFKGLFKVTIQKTCQSERKCLCQLETGRNEGRKRHRVIAGE